MPRKSNPVIPPHLRLPEGQTQEQVWKAIQDSLARFPKPPKRALPIEVWRETLRVFKVPERQIKKCHPKSTDALLEDFSNLVVNSPYGMITGWKAVVVDEEQLVPLLSGLGLAVSLEVKAKEYRVRVASEGNEIRMRRSWSWDDNDFHGQVFDWERILPNEIQVYALVEYDKTDTFGHIFLPADRWLRVQQQLGDWFGCTFWKHPADMRFKPEKGPSTQKGRKTSKTKK